MNINKIRVDEVVRDRDKIIAVSRTSPFYPDGKGGQLGDRGKIGPANVLKVKEKDGYILHYLDTHLEPGEYEYEIDLARRKDIACQHTAQHILSAAFLKVADLETVSFLMGERVSTIDLNAPFVLEDVLEEAEDLANEVVRSCERVEILEIEKEEAEKMNLRKLPNVEGKVRVVKIGDFDVTACGGFHVENTGEIGLIKIVDTEKVKKVLTRIYFVAGDRALKDYREKDKLLKSLSRVLTTSTKELLKRAENLLEEVKEKSAKLDKLSEKYAEILSKVAEPEKIGKYYLYHFSGTPEEMKYLPKFLADRKDTIVLLEHPDRVEIVSNWIDCRKIFEKLKEQLNIEGGSSQKRAVITANSTSRIVEKLREILKWF